MLLPIGAGLIIFSDEIIIGLMGNKWKDAIIVVKLITLYGMLAGFGGNATLFLRAIGKADITATIQMVRAPILIVVFLYCAPKGLFAISLSHAVMMALVIPLYLFITMKAVGINPYEGFQIFIKPIIALAVFISAALVLKRIFSELGIFNPLISLPLCFLVYTVTIFLTDAEMKIEFKEKIAKIMNERMG
jgi:lipopolysaccharide exporter